MTTTPADALPVLLDRACRGVATPAEAEQLRAGVHELQQQAEANVAEALDIEHANLTAEMARADRYRLAWQSARRRNRWARSILDGYRADTIASRTKQAACDHRDPKRLGARRDLATVCACGHVLFPPVFGPRPDGQP